MKTEREVEDCRRNGDAYGTETISCLKCDWSMSQKFDDASEVYYYESAYQPAPPPPEPPIPQNRPLREDREELCANMARFGMTRAAIHAVMVKGGIREEDIEAFVLKYNVNS